RRRGVPTAPVYHRVDGVARGEDRARPRTDHARPEPRAAVQGEGRGGGHAPYIEALLEHVAGPVIPLFAGLKVWVPAPRELIAVPHEQTRRAHQHRDMGIVAAGVHDALDCGGELE